MSYIPAVIFVEVDSELRLQDLMPAHSVRLSSVIGGAREVHQSSMIFLVYGEAYYLVKIVGGLYGDHKLLVEGRPRVFTKDEAEKLASSFNAPVDYAKPEGIKHEGIVHLKS